MILYTVFQVQTSANLISNLASQGDHIAQMADGARPVVHEDVVGLMERWISLMRSSPDCG